jgi:hypothetical protein
MQGDYKFHLNQKVDVYIGKKLMSIAPRGTIKLTEEDIEASPQIRELLVKNALRMLPPQKVKASTTPAKPSSKTKDEPKEKD